MTNLLLDPNVVYFVLVAALWVAVTAAYIPGTGFVEGLALVSLIAGLVALANMATNWAGVLLIILGVLSFLLIPLFNQRYARFAEVGLVPQILGAAILFNDTSVSWLIILTTIGLSVLYHRLVLLPLLNRNRHQRAVIDNDASLVGSYGRVVKASKKIGPAHVGSINVRGEQWTATSEQPLRPGEMVVVVEREGLQLFVEEVKHKQSPINEINED